MKFEMHITCSVNDKWTVALARADDGRTIIGEGCTAWRALQQAFESLWADDCEGTNEG